MTIKEPLYIIKIGGNVIDNESSLNSFLKKFSHINYKKILVHGGGKIATTFGNRLGIESKYIDGRRITDDNTIDLVTMVYGGLINKKISAILQSLECNAIGLSGADANILPAKKRVVKDIDYGWAGDIVAENINPSALQLFINNDIVPVVASLTHDREGHILNTNADTIAFSLATALSKLYSVHLIYCFEKDGVLADVNDESSVIAELNPITYQSLKEDKKLFAGILPKIDNALEAVNNGVSDVVIGNSEKLAELIKNESGTKIIS